MRATPERDRSNLNARLRNLASVDEVLKEDGAQSLLERYPRTAVVDAIRTVLQRLRADLLADESAHQRSPSALASVTPAALVPWIERILDTAFQPSLQRVINATGVVVHTNLGRALLPEEAVDAIAMAAGNYTNLEFSLARGERASRQDHVHDVLCTLSGAEDALVVNNCAAALLLALAATARDGEVLVSRGQLVEIGDGFRIPDILRESGAELVEVGTTNRTYLRDFEKAWSPRTKAILRVHTSNYRVVGFATQPSLTDLVSLAEERGAVLVEDLGSGALADLELFQEEPSLKQSIAAGCNVVTFSGDKLLGGPQAGIVVGRAAEVDAMRRHPLARALRIDKLDLAALDAVLRLYLDPEVALRRVPTLALLSEPLEEVKRRGERLRSLLLAGTGDHNHFDEADVAVVESVARAGAGALPVTEVPSAAVAVRVGTGDTGQRAAQLREGRPAVLCRVQEDSLVFDLRAVREHEVNDLAAAITRTLS